MRGYLIILPLLLCFPAGAEPMQVTTDTLEYCMSLAGRLAGTRGISAALSTKVEEGRRMCQNGRVRTGLITLRHVAMMLRTDELDFPSVVR